jgi:hypothetical protein
VLKLVLCCVLVEGGDQQENQGSKLGIQVTAAAAGCGGISGCVVLVLQ